MSSIIDELKKWFKTATPQEQASFLDMVSKETELFNMLKQRGFMPHIEDIGQTAKAALPNQDISLTPTIVPQPPMISGIRLTPLFGRVVTSNPPFIERWEYLKDARNARDFFFGQYTGRSYPFSPVWKSEIATDPSTWNLPLWKPDDAPATEGTGWMNAVDMTNSKDGKTIDEIYIQPRAVFDPPCVMRITCKFPASVPAGASLIFGFEVNSQGGQAIYQVLMDSTGFHLKSNCITPTANPDPQDAAITLTDQTNYHNLWLYYDPPKLYLWGWNGSATALLGTVTIGHSPDAYDCVSPFVTNESSSIVSGFCVGHWAVWQKKKPRSGNYFVAIGIGSDGALWYNKYTISTGTWGGFASFGTGIAEVINMSIVNDVLFILIRNYVEVLYYKIFNLANDSLVVDWTALSGYLTNFFGVRKTSTEPALKYAGLVWVDTSGSEVALKVRNKANTAWLSSAGTHGSYSEDSTVNRAIPHGLGKIPSVVLIWQSMDALNPYRDFKIISGYANILLVNDTTGGMAESSVTAMDATNFYVGNAADYAKSANISSPSYYWCAIP